MSQILLEQSRIARQIVESSSSVPLEYFRQKIEIEAKQDESPVTIADKNTELAIREQLAKHFPEDGIFGEEFGFMGDETKRLWIIDPIDGTRSFISGSPLFGMLIGLIERGEAQIGIVRMPRLDETYCGVKGQPATLNGEEITTRRTANLADSFIYINEGETICKTYPELFYALGNIGANRRMAYDCYPHALVAAGQIDGVIDFNLQPYDYLPLVALIRSAGGVITDWYGKPLHLGSKGHVITACNETLHRQMLDYIAPHILDV